MKRWQILGLSLWGTIVFGYLGTFLGLRLFQTRLIFRPSTPVPNLTPADLGWTAEAVTLTVPSPESTAPTQDSTQDNPDRPNPNLTLQGWWFPPKPTPPDTPAQAIVLFLGRQKTMADHWQDSALRYRIAALLSQTSGLLMLDYQGYGQSPGPRPTESQLYANGEAAWQFLRDQQGLEPNQIILYGYSLGSSVALELALRYPDAGGVIVEGGFTTLEQSLDRHLNSYPFLKIFPLDLILTQTFDNLSRIAQLQVPLLIIHGTADEVVPVELGQALFAAAPQPKEMLLIQGATHETAAWVGEDQYIGTVQQFLRSTFPAPNE